MHSTFVIAAFALCTIAAPVPEADPIFKGNQGSCTHRGSLLICPPKRAIDLESHATTYADVGDVEARAIRNEGRSPALSRPKKGSRDSDLVEVDTRAIRNEGRSPALSRPKKGSRDSDHAEVDARAIRNEGRSPALSRPKKGSRDSDHAEVDARAIRNEGRSPALSRPKKGSRDLEEYDLHARELDEQEAVRGQRRAADPINRNTKSSRASEPADKDDMQTEGAVREPGKGRPAHPRAVKGSNKRTAEAKPVFRAGSG